MREPPVEQALAEAPPLPSPPSSPGSDDDTPGEKVSEAQVLPSFPVLVPGPRNSSQKPLPVSLSGFTTLPTSRFEDAKQDVCMLGPHDGVFPFEKQLLFVAFWQALFITEAVLSDVSAPLSKAPEWCSKVAPAAAHVWVLHHFVALKQQGILEDICFDSVQGFQRKKSNKSTLVAAWCLHCPFCSCFISCSQLLNVYEHFKEHCGGGDDASAAADAILQSFALVKECFTSLEGFHAWEYLEQEKSLLFPGSESVLQHFDVFVSVDTFGSFCSNRSVDDAVFLSLLVYIWTECFHTQFQPLLKDIANQSMQQDKGGVVEGVDSPPVPSAKRKRPRKKSKK